MALAPGTRLGVYEILTPIGAGGMGEVYQARDTRLKREVALKVLPDNFAHDVDRLARFQREAELLATLNHPNIAGIYGLEESNGVQALVLELVEGPTLADRIARGPIPLDDALPIARQIADALEAAHEKGVIHRDLKPANIKITPDGSVKVLDFGLAKLAEAPAVSGAGVGVSQSPTITTPAMTGVGVILGTAAYMSPEQAKGRPADKRSDIWAFGCVLYEMLTGTRVFHGEDVSDTLAAVLRGEPDWNALPADLPPAVRLLLERCLEKDRRQRIGDMAAALFVLRDSKIGSVTPNVTDSRQRPRAPMWRRAVPFVVTAVTTAALVFVAEQSTRSTIPTPTVARFQFTLPEGQQFAESLSNIVAISPDGTQMVYAANQRLYIRAISEINAKPIPGSEVTAAFIGNPVFSPDGRSIAFWSGGTTLGAIKRIAVTGGPVLTICEAAIPLGMTWGVEGIVFGQSLINQGGRTDRPTIMRVSDRGGPAEHLLTVEDGLPWGPQILPGGEAVLFSVGKGITRLADATVEGWAKADVVVQSLKSGQRQTLIEGGSAATYVPTGHLVYGASGTLFAVGFDVKRLHVTGERVPVVQGVRRPTLPNPGALYFGVSDTGSLIYVPGPVITATEQRQLAFIDRKGTVETLKLREGSYHFPRISPDGKRLAVEMDEAKDSQVWIYDLSGTSSIRQLTNGGRNRFPVWAPDGQHVAFQSDREGDRAIYWQPADGSRPAERLTKPTQGSVHLPEAWSRVGNTLLFSVNKDSTFSLWSVRIPDKIAARVGDLQFPSPFAATFSPDGRWIAYLEGDAAAGFVSVFVQPFPPTGAKHRIGLGFHPLWAPDGKELFSTLRLLPRAISVTTQPGLVFGDPVPVTMGVLRDGAPGSEREYDVTPDGHRFIGTVPAGEAQGGSGAPRIEVVLNWLEELKQHAPTK